MNKKFGVLILLFALVPGTLVAYAASNFDPQKYWNSKEYSILCEVGSELEASLCTLGDSILAYNKPALDVKLTKQERTVRDLDDYDEEGPIPVQPVMYARVCVKGKTIVLGVAEKDKKYRTKAIITGEQDFPPGNHSIKVGANISVIERRVGMSAENISKIQGGKNGIINADPASFVFADIAYRNGKITELYFMNGYDIVSQKAWKFATKKARDLGLVLAPEF